MTTGTTTPARHALHEGRELGGELVGQLLKQFDSVTKLSCLCEPETFH